MGWQPTAKVMGLVLLVVIVPLSFNITDTQSVSASPWTGTRLAARWTGRPVTARRHASDPRYVPEEYSLGQTLHSWAFWNLTGGTALRLIAKTGATVHIIPSWRVRACPSRPPPGCLACNCS